MIYESNAVHQAWFIYSSVTRSVILVILNFAVNGFHESIPLWLAFGRARVLHFPQQVTD